MTAQAFPELIDADPALLSESEAALVALIRREIAGHGAISFARFMELALYAPGFGYYQTADRRPGRGGDFLTAPEATPLFGLTLARQVAECWDLLDRPDPFVIREYGAGIGGLAYDVLAGLSDASPAAFEAADYRLVEISAERLAPALAAMDEAGLARKVRAELAGETPGPISGVVLANEVADALPVHRLLWSGGAMRELGVAWQHGWFAEVEMPVSPPAEPFARRIEAIAAPLHEGDRFTVSPAAADWMKGLARGIARGFALVIDYGYPTDELYAPTRRDGLIRAYADHAVSDDPYRRVGRQDLTAHVDFDALSLAAERAGMRRVGLTTQADLLTALGMGDFLVAMQRDTTLEEYLGAQAAVLRLIDPGGLGRFRILALAKSVTLDRPLRGFRQISGLM